MIFFTENPIVFQPGEFYTVQTMANLPSLPLGKRALGQGYNLVATQGTQPITGSISFQYLSVDALTEGLSEEDEAGLTIHFWDGDTWEALPSTRDGYYNLVSAPSRGPGVYALLTGATRPVVKSVAPSVTTAGLTTTLTITGANFLKPVRVALLDSASAYTMPARMTSSNSITAVMLTDSLPAGEYQVHVVNGDGTSGPAKDTLSLLGPGADACYYDFFESGANQWEADGDWAIVTLAGGERAMTDSPAGNYRSAVPPANTHTTSIASGEFSLNGCKSPVLSFRHDYVLARLNSSQDVAQVEISTDGGTTWTTLASYKGGGIYDPGGASTGSRGDAGGGSSTPVVQEAESAEWANADWKSELISLQPYTGTVRLRFSLEVDQHVSDKGWIIDEVEVK